MISSTMINTSVVNALAKKHNIDIDKDKLYPFMLDFAKYLNGEITDDWAVGDYSEDLAEMLDDEMIAYFKERGRKDGTYVDWTKDMDLGSVIGYDVTEAKIPINQQIRREIAAANALNKVGLNNSKWSRINCALFTLVLYHLPKDDSKWDMIRKYVQF